MKSLNKKPTTGNTSVNDVRLPDSDHRYSRDLRERADYLSDEYEKAVFLQILRGLLDDVQRLRPGTKGLERDYVTLEARVKHEGIAFLGTALCSLGNAFDKGLSNGYFACPTGFKTRKGEAIPLLFGGILRDVFDAVTGDLKERDSTEDVKILRQLLFFLEETVLYAPSRIASRSGYATQFRLDGSLCREHSSL